MRSAATAEGPIPPFPPQVGFPAGAGGSVSLGGTRATPARVWRRFPGPAASSRPPPAG